MGRKGSSESVFGLYFDVYATPGEGKTPSAAPCRKKISAPSVKSPNLTFGRSTEREFPAGLPVLRSAEMPCRNLQAGSAGGSGRLFRGRDPALPGSAAGDPDR